VSKKNERSRRRRAADYVCEYIRHWSGAARSRHHVAIAPAFAMGLRVPRKMALSESDRAFRFSPIRSGRSRFRKPRRSEWRERDGANEIGRKGKGDCKK